MKRNIKGKLFNYTLIDLITLHQLRIFELAAITGSFTQAAKELNLKQPTVSAQIKQLEGTIGLPLFERLGKRLYLTDAGRALQSACHEILTQIDQTEQHLSEYQETIQGTLHLAATTTAKYFLPEGIKQFHEQYPEVYISLTVNNHDVVIDRLNNHIDDLYIFSRLPDRDDLIVQAFLANPLVVIAPINHWLSQAPMPIPLSIVAAELMIMRERGSATREASESFFAQQELLIHPRFELGSNEVIKMMVSQGLGVAILSQHSLNRFTHMPQIKILDVEHFPIQQQWYVAYPQGKRVSRIMKLFTDFCLGQHAVIFNS